MIKETFENSFDKGRFTRFSKNLLNHIEEAPFTYQGQYIPEAYRQYISTLERIGKFNDGENRIDILIIKLQKETSLERARTMQRNFVAWYLNGSRGGERAQFSPCRENERFCRAGIHSHATDTIRQSRAGEKACGIGENADRPA